MVRVMVASDGHLSDPETEYDSLDTSESYEIGPVYCGKIQRGSVAYYMLKQHGYTDEDIFGGEGK